MFTKKEVTFLKNGSSRYFPNFTRNYGKSQSVGNLSYRIFMYTADAPFTYETSGNNIIICITKIATNDGLLF